MSQITPLDQLFITVTQNGISRLFTELSGVTSLCDIVSYIRSQVPELNGLAIINIRNRSEGWSARHSALIR